MTGAPAPVVGDRVHYVRERNTTQCLAAIVTAVDEMDFGDEVSLKVFPPDGNDFNVDCPLEPSEAHGHWHWPERV